MHSGWNPHRRWRLFKNKGKIRPVGAGMVGGGVPVRDERKQKKGKREKRRPSGRLFS
jgi:hypothetical protein